VKKIKRIMGEELFNAAKKTIDEFEHWYNKNEEHIREWAKSAGTDLVNAFNKVVEAVKWIAKHWEEITATVRFLVEVWLASKLVDTLTKIIGQASRLKTIFGAIAGEATAGEAIAGEATAGGATAGKALAVASFATTGFIGVAVANLVGGIERLRHNVAEIEKAEDWIEKAKKQAPWLYEEAEKYAERRTAPQYEWLGGEPQPDWEFVNYQKDIVKYIKEHWENTIKIHEKFSEYMESFLEQISEQSSALTDFFMSTMGQTINKEIPFQTKPKAHPPVIDMHGSKIEIKMDVRHLDPDRVAAAVMTGLSRAAHRKVASKIPYPYLVSG
jgi:hypothetical protein